MSRLRIEIVPIDMLISHEDVEKQRLLNILGELSMAGILRKPVIVDEKRYIVIDGHHRVSALKILGARHIPVVLADYSSDISDVGGWMYTASRWYKDQRLLKKIVSEAEFSAKRGDGLLIFKMGYEVVEARVDRIDFYLAIKELGFHKILNSLTKTPVDPETCLAHDICLAPPKLVVDDIYRIVSKNLLLPPRTTCHKTVLKNVTMEFKLKHFQKSGD
ncbi:MAG: ParB N-terminal domain-containing protein [Ignisphaera sp.]